MVPSTASQAAWIDAYGSWSTVTSRPRPTSRSLSRDSTRPSVHSASRLPSGIFSSTDSNGTPPTPSGAPEGSSRIRPAPPGSGPPVRVGPSDSSPGTTSTGGMWPALATVRVAVAGSNTAYTQVASRASSGPWARSSASSWTCRSSTSGGRSRAASTRTAVRSRPIVAAARRPCPITSPTTSAVRSPGSGMTSNQSPPTSVPLLPGTYRYATSTPVGCGTCCGSRVRWRVRAAVRSRA